MRARIALKRLLTRPAEELRTAAALGLYLFILLSSYYVLKTVREALILAENGAAVKVYAAGAQAAMLVALVPVYNRLANRLPRVQLIGAVLAFFSVVLAAFAVAGHLGVRIGVPFFLWIGVFNVFVIAQFWSFAADLFSEEDGIRVFPLIGIGGALGGWLGSLAAKRMFAGRDPYQIIWIACAALLFCIPLTYFISRHRTMQPEAERTRLPLASADGLRLVLRDPYLRLIAILTVLLNVCSTTGEYIFGSVATEHARALIYAGQNHGLTDKQIIGTIYGTVFTWVNAVGLVLQVLVVPLAFRSIGVGGALFILPVIVLAGYSVVAVAPVLAVAQIVRIIESSVSYSMQSTTNNSLFLRTVREAKYKAKIAIDTVFWRMGDVLSAALVFAGTTLLSLGRSAFALANVALASVWTVVAAALFLRYKKGRRRSEVGSEERRKHYVGETESVTSHC